MKSVDLFYRLGDGDVCRVSGNDMGELKKFKIPHNFYFTLFLFVLQGVIFTLNIPRFLLNNKNHFSSAPQENALATTSPMSR